MSANINNEKDIQLPSLTKEFFDFSIKPYFMKLLSELAAKIGEKDFQDSLVDFSKRRMAEFLKML